ncbi:MAG: hypothetical protein JXB25_02875, partial [Deltaproteobacteria bacterium]|nr:hypothetical protein [Deltaproteobacteria bacterium]
IGAEKGGIIKQRTPVVIGPQEPPVRTVLLARAAAKAARAYLWERDFEAVSMGRTFSYRGPRTALEDLHPALLGRHQHANLAMSLCAAELVREAGYPVPDAALRTGVETVCWPGRLEWWRGLRRVLLDGAHNGAGARVLGAYLEAEGIDGIHWVLGIKWDKDAGEILAPILPRCRALYCTVAREETFIDPHHLAAEGSRNGVASEAFADPEAAFRAAMQRRREGETILVAGSLFIVGAVREVLEMMELKP